MSRFKLDHDEGMWLLTIDLGSDDLTLRLDDTDAFELNAALEPIRFRRREYEKHEQVYKGLRLAGYFNHVDWPNA